MIEKLILRFFSVDKGYMEKMRLASLLVATSICISGRFVGAEFWPFTFSFQNPHICACCLSGYLSPVRDMSVPTHGVWLKRDDLAQSTTVRTLSQNKRGYFRKLYTDMVAER